MAYSSVADLTVDELKSLIREVVTQTILELFGDPDEGLELREDIEERLRHSLAATEAGSETTPAQEVTTKLGIAW